MMGLGVVDVMVSLAAAGRLGLLAAPPGRAATMRRTLSDSPVQPMSPLHMTPLQQRRIGPFQTPAIGLGCMNLSHAYGKPPSAAQGEAVLRAAFDAGVRLFDTAALYGFGANETLVGRVLKHHRSQIVLCSKGGMAGVTQPDGSTKRVIDGRPAAIRRDCEDSLQRLQTDVIDLYYLHRWHKLGADAVAIEDSVGELARLVQAGKVRSIGLSEVSAATLRRAHAVHPIAAVQTEYSLWTRNAEIAVLQACQDIGAAFVAFSPVARGFLSDSPPDASTFDGRDIRHGMPRFAAENYAANLALLAGVRAVAAEAGCTVAQLALAWLLSRGAHVLPIPGTTSVAHVLENFAALQVRLTAAQGARLDAVLNERTVKGVRYAAQASSEVDTETFDNPAA
jgi:aryl-alcohol dehydrogenase-like predicted oxidoreductase